MPYKWDFSIVSLPARWVSLFCTVQETWSWFAYFWYYFHCNALNPHQIVQMARVGVQVDFKGHVVVIQGLVRRMYFLKAHVQLRNDWIQFHSDFETFRFFGCVYPSPGHPFDVKNGNSRPKSRGYYPFSRFWLFPVTPCHKIVFGCGVI